MSAHHRPVISSPRPLHLKRAAQTVANPSPLRQESTRLRPERYDRHGEETNVIHINHPYSSAYQHPETRPQTLPRSTARPQPISYEQRVRNASETTIGHPPLTGSPLRRERRVETTRVPPGGRGRDMNHTRRPPVPELPVQPIHRRRQSSPLRRSLETSSIKTMDSGPQARITRRAEADALSLSCRLSLAPGNDLKTAVPELLHTYHKFTKAFDRILLHAENPCVKQFAAALDHVLASVDELPWNVRGTSIFIIARDDVSFYRNRFLELLDDLSRAEEDRKAEHLLDYILQLMVSLKMALRSAERQFMQTKALPALPTAVPLQVPCSQPPVVETVSHRRTSSAATPVRNSVRRVVSLGSSRSADKKGRHSLDRPVISGPIHLDPEFSSSTSSQSSLSDDSHSQETWTPEEEAYAQKIRAAEHLRSHDNVRASLALFPSIVPGDDDINPIDDLRPYTDPDILYDSAGHVWGLTEERIVGRLCPKDAVIDLEFTDMALTCFRLWASPLRLVQLLFKLYRATGEQLAPFYGDEYNLVDPIHVRLRVVRIFMIWFERYWRPKEDAVVIDHIISFVRSNMHRHFSGRLARDLLEKLRYLSSPEGRARQPRSLQRTAIAAQNLGLKYARPSLLDLTKLRSLRLVRDFATMHALSFAWDGGTWELARQLTIMESELYLGAEPEDVLLVHVAPARSDPAVSEQLQRHSMHTSNVTLWVGNSVLSKDEPHARAATVALFVDLAWKCVQLRNLSAAHSIWNGLMSYHLERLMLTQKEIKQSVRKNLDLLTELFDARNNFAKCTELIRSNSLPSIPLMSSYRSLLIRIEAGSKPKVGDEKQFINIQRYDRLTTIIREMESTHAAYKIKRNTTVQNYLSYALCPSRLLTGGALDDKCRAIAAVELKPPSSSSKFRRISAGRR